MKNLSIEKREYRDGIKRKETRQGWMDGWMLPLSQQTKINSLYDNK